MALTIKKKTGEKTSSMADMLSQFQKDLGEGVGSFGGELLNSDRIPTGLFPLDLAMGGGFPRGKCSIIFGPESSNKTNVALRAIAMHQLLWPDLTCVFFDIENAFDPEWARKMGVNTDKLIVVRPSYAEQAVDMAEGFMHAEDCGLVVIDSLAALLTTSEAEASAERANVGGAALVIGKLTRKTNHAMGEAEKNGRLPSLIYINQISYKIGVMFGDPETMPGGKKPYFQASMILRCYGKNVMDPKVSTALPVLKETNFIVKKWKCPILSVNGNFSMVTHPHKGLNVGQCDDFTQVRGYLEAFGKFQKAEKQGWLILGEHYPTIEPFKTKLYEDKQFGTKVREGIIARMLTGELLLEGDSLKDQISD